LLARKSPRPVKPRPVCRQVGSLRRSSNRTGLLAAPIFIRFTTRVPDQIQAGTSAGPIAAIGPPVRRIPGVPERSRAGQNPTKP